VCCCFFFCSSLHGPRVALELMCTIDNEAHSPLDWAADHGDINVIEFFIRKGMNPYRHDHMNRSPLYWAVKANQLEAARFLVMLGCDPNQKDTIGQSPMSIALTSQSKAMFKALSVRNQNQDLLSQMSEQEVLSMTHVRDKIPRLYHEQTRRSFAIYHRNPSSIAMTIFYFLFFVILWLFVVIVPSYAVIAIVVIGAICIRQYNDVKAAAASLSYLLPITAMTTPSSRSTHSTHTSAVPLPPLPAVGGDSFFFFNTTNNTTTNPQSSYLQGCWEGMQKITRVSYTIH